VGVANGLKKVRTVKRFDVRLVKGWSLMVRECLLKFNDKVHLNLLLVPEHLDLFILFHLDF